MFRLHLDIPMGDNVDKAKEDAIMLLATLKEVLMNEGFTETTYKLMRDGDRSGRNILNVVDGREMTKKLTLYGDLQVD